jgi:hypothetical protein
LPDAPHIAQRRAPSQGGLRERGQTGSIETWKALEQDRAGYREY